MLCHNWIGRPSPCMDRPRNLPIINDYCIPLPLHMASLSHAEIRLLLANSGNNKSRSINLCNLPIGFQES